MTVAVALAERPVVIEPGSLPLPLAAADLFGRTCPLELEIGAGKGRFLLAWALAHPELGLLGVERTAKYLRHAALRVARSGVPNVRLIRTTAEDLLFRCLAEGSVAAVHVYFPDPWPKKRHHKRRLVTPENAARIAAVLAPGGVLRVKTDHDAYADTIGAVLAATPGLEAVASDDAFEGLPATSFEIKYGVERRHVHRLAFRRRAVAPVGGR